MSKRIAEIVYAEFGFRAFLTRDFSPDAMSRLGRTLKIATNDPIRNVKIGQRLSAMEHKLYTLKSGVRVKMTVARPNNDRRPRRFRLIDIAAPFRQTPGAPQPPEAEIAYEVLVVRSDAGYTASCPALPGCHARGRTETEALFQLRNAIARRRRSEARAAVLRTQAMLEEYRAAGYRTKRAEVIAPRGAI